MGILEKEMETTGLGFRRQRNISYRGYIKTRFPYSLPRKHKV